MKYLLRGAHIGSQVAIEIDKARYEHLAHARKTLVDAGAFEERYELLLGNYTAFEVFCAEVSLKGSYELDIRYEKWARVISEANRHAINFLTMTRLYRDQVKGGFKHLELSEPFKHQAKRLLDEAYTNDDQFRFTETFRNHVQHVAFAVHGLKGRPKGAPLLEGTLVYCQKKHLAEDPKFTKEDLAVLDENIDLLSMFRGYMAKMSRIHIALRKQIKEACTKARADIQKAKDEYTEAQPEEERSPHTAISLTACKMVGDKFSDPVILMLDWDDARVALSQKNMRAITLPEISA